MLQPTTTALRPAGRLGPARPWRSLPAAPMPRWTRAPAIRPRAQQRSGALPEESSSRPHCYPQQAGPVQQRRSDPEQTLQGVMELAKAGDLDGLVEFVADEVIDTVLEARRTAGVPASSMCFADILAANAPHQLYLDTYALRNLVFARPQAFTPVSAVRVGADRYVARCAVLAPSGEECMLTLELSLQESMEVQYRGPPLLSHKWMLRSVTGETCSDKLPAHPSPSFAPEAVVQAQLQWLRDGNVRHVFAHASPDYKAALGKVERLVATFGTPAYAPLVHHAEAHCVKRMQTSENSYTEVVVVTPCAERASLAALGLLPPHVGGDGELGDAAGEQPQLQQLARPQRRHAAAPGTSAGAAAPVRLYYMWQVRRQSCKHFEGCWMTDSVHLVGAEALPPRGDMVPPHWP